MNEQHAQHPVSSAWFVTLLAISSGAVVANLYYSQAIVASIGPDVGLTNEQAGLIVALTQMGYAAGLFFLVPLADLVENRRLIQIMISASALCLTAAGVTENPLFFLVMSFLIGATTISGQLIIPLATYFTPADSHGKLVGNILGGLLMGILLARPLASLMAEYFGWRSIYFLATVLMLLTGLALTRVLPQRAPSHAINYRVLVRSLKGIWKAHPELRYRSFYQACLFGCFSIYWTAVPAILYTTLGLSHTEIALFALIGLTGALAAPIAGKLADAGYTAAATLFALVVTTVEFLYGSFLSDNLLIGLTVIGFFLNFTVQMHLVLGQRVIFQLDPESRGRLNALYMTSVFIGGAIGSIAATHLLNEGWTTISGFGSLLAGAASLAFLYKTRMENRQRINYEG